MVLSASVAAVTVWPVGGNNVDRESSQQYCLVAEMHKKSNFDCFGSASMMASDHRWSTDCFELGVRTQVVYQSFLWHPVTANNKREVKMWAPNERKVSQVIRNPIPKTQRGKGNIFASAVLVVSAEKIWISDDEWPKENSSLSLSESVVNIISHTNERVYGLDTPERDQSRLEIWHNVSLC